MELYIILRFSITIRIDEVVEGQKLQKKLRDTTCKWKQIRETTITMIRDTAANLQSYQRGLNITQITGSAASVAGTALGVVGFFLAPPLAIGGAALAIAGGLTKSGASAVETIVTKSGVNEAQKQLKQDEEMLKEMQDIQNEIEEQNERIKDKCPNIDESDILQVTTLYVHPFIKGVSREISLKAGQTAGEDVKKLGEGQIRFSATGTLTKMGIITNLVILPINLIVIVKSGYNIWNENECEASKQLRETADHLEQQKEEICGPMGLL